MKYLNKTIKGITDRGDAGLFINGDWRKGGNGQMLDVIAPHSEELLLRYREATIDDVDDAVAAARSAFDKGPWPRLSPQERGVQLKKVAALLRSRMPEIAEAWTGQVGAVIGMTTISSHNAPNLFDYYGDLAQIYPFVEARNRSSGGKVRIVREPAGVIATITPWNAPLILLCYKTAASLAAGCTVVAKPSPETPIDAHILAECIAEAGLPEGVFNMLPAGREVGDHLIRHPGIDKVSFTGSTAAGKHIAAACADRLTRVSLELGGKSAAMILEDASIEDVLPSLVPFSMPITGQACFSLTRILVPRKRRDEIVDAYVSEVSKVKVGDPFAEDTRMGPLALQRQLVRVQDYIEKGRSEGAKLALGGQRPAALNRGFFIEPTVFVNVDSEMTIAKEEIFGPVVSFIDYENEEDLVNIANATNYGLHGAVYTHDAERGYEIARQVRSGSVTVNGMIVDIEMPFGGFKQSGIGREGGIEGLESYTETKCIYFA